MKKDDIQNEIINSKDNLLVIASAGCGKTFTITKKINKLLNTIKPEEILVISFTNETVKDLKKKLNDKINVLTFHKLAMKILEEANYSFSLSADELLNYTINNFFENEINEKDIKKLKFYFLELNYEALLKTKSFLDYKKIIITFIKLIQCNNYNFDNLKTIYRSSKDKFLISLIMKIYYYYKLEKKQNETIDLDDLIIKAGNIANTKKFNYKYIFVDEFQDTSEIRFNLVYNIFKNSNSKINFFGDDFQSIYAFSGCNLFIMLNIKERIPDIKTINLNKNFRSDNHLINTANKFVLKNPLQLRKNVTSDIHLKNSINYIYYKNLNKSINTLLENLNCVSDDIMILGRYKSDFRNIDPKYKCLTIHESKGLEAKFVIILNLKDDTYGFPSQIKNSRLLNYFEAKDTYVYAEERRIFYVAITRAKEKVFLMIPKKNHSSFYKEFKEIDKQTNL